MKKMAISIIILLLTSCSALNNYSENKFNGYFSYLADAAIFIECETNKTYPVVMDEEYLELEKEYLKIIKTSGEKVFVSCIVEIKLRDKIEGEGKRDFIKIQKLIEIKQNKKCK